MPSKPHAAEDQPTKQEPLPDWRKMWDFGDPAATEARFRKALEAGRSRGDAEYVAIVTTQLARSQGLQGHFDAAHATLDGLADTLEGASPEVRIRYLLERGRAFNSGGQKEKSVPLFEEAWKIGREAKLDVLAVDAAHMLAIVLPTDKGLAWSDKAMALCEASQDPRCKGWLGPLYNNTGWTWFERGKPAKALELWEKGLALRKKAGDPGPLFVARYTVARAWRALGRYEEALAEERAIWDGREAAGLDPDGFVAEEIAECFEAMGRDEEATPWFQKAWKLLSKTQGWMEKEEPERWARLRSKGAD